MITHGDSTGFLEITQTIAEGTGRFEGATGSGTGVVNLNSAAVIIAAGTITLPDEITETGERSWLGGNGSQKRSNGANGVNEARSLE